MASSSPCTRTVRPALVRLCHSSNSVGVIPAVALLALNACNGSKETPQSTVPAAATSSEAAAKSDEVNGATLTGKVVFTGEVPLMRNIYMSANPACQRCHPTKQRSEEVVVNPNGTQRYAFVWIKSGLPDRSWETPSEAVLLNQTGCMYRPHVIDIMAGQKLEIRNNDPTNHNIHPLPSVNPE